MKRLAEFYLLEWKNDHNRKSLLIRGARQVGKTFTVREFGRTFANVVEVNFESKPDLARLFDFDLNPLRITQDMALGFDGKPWILEPDAAFANAGQLAEAFVGQELLAYSQTDRAASLHYWHREERSSMAEVDYVVAGGGRVIPVEVKRGTTGQLKSLRLFLNARKSVAPYGVRFSLHNFSRQPDLHSYPLYAVIAFAAVHNPTLREAVRMLGNG